MLSKKIVKYIQSLSHKKFRDEEAVFVAEGPKVVEEFLTSGRTNCQLICGYKDWLSQHESLLKNISSEKIFETDDHWIKSVSQLKTPNKVVAVFDKFPKKENENFKNKITFVLDDIQDPGNLGTIIRIADWFAIENIICSADSVDCYNSKVVQSTMGSLSRVNVQYTDLHTFLQKQKNIAIWAAALSGTSIFDIPKTNEAMILIGNESKGLSKEFFDIASQKITIPRPGNAESLNAAVAAGIIASHIILKPY